MDTDFILLLAIIAVYGIIFLTMYCPSLITFPRPKPVRRDAKERLEIYSQVDKIKYSLSDEEMSKLNIRLSNDGGIYGILTVAVLFSLLFGMTGLTSVLLKILLIIIVVIYVFFYVKIYRKRSKKDFFDKKDDFKKVAVEIIDIKKIALSANGMRSGNACYAYVLCEDDTNTIKEYKVQITYTMYMNFEKNRNCWGILYKGKLVNLLPMFSDKIN